MARPRAISFRVYFEGILLPCQVVTAQVQMSPFVPLQAAISIPPIDMAVISKLRVRTHVAVFFRQEGGVDAEWRLLFDGEYVGFGVSRAAGSSMSMDLYIEGIDTYWWNTYALHFQAAASIASSNAFDAKLVFGIDGSQTRIVDSQGRSPIPLESDIQRIVGGTDAHFPDLFAQLLKYVPKLSEFFRLADGRLRFSDRLAFVPDDEIVNLVKNEQAAEIFGAAFNQAPQDSRLMSILQSMMGNLFYVYQTIATPGIVDGVLKQFLLMPHIPELAPPRCNVIFPSKNANWSFRRMFLEEPTRGRFSMPPITGGGDRSWEMHYYAPRQMEAIARQVMAGGEVTIDGLILSDPSLPLESREDIKGVIPKIETFQGYEALASGIANPDERDKYFSNLSERELVLAQHRGRVMQQQGPFNPYVLPGFPGVLIDKRAIVLGNVTSVSHSFTASGAATTQVVMDTCRENEDLGALQRPVWQNARFADPARIGSTYASLLGKGHGSILDPFNGPVVVNANQSQVAAAKALRSVYDSTIAQEAFEEAYTRREIAGLDAYFHFVRARSSGDQYVGGPIRADWQGPVRDVVTELGSVVKDAS